jgi:hypothetical protein
MRIGISGTHGTGKTTLVQALSTRLRGHATADEPYYLLEEEGHEFGFPPSVEDYRALLARSIRSLGSPLPRVVFDRTPLDYLAYLAATGADLAGAGSAAALQSAFAGLDLLVITLITPQTEQALPAAQMPRLRAEMNDALLELAHDDPLDAWKDIPLLELTGPLDGRVDVVLAALDQCAGTRSLSQGRWPGGAVTSAARQDRPRRRRLPSGPLPSAIRASSAARNCRREAPGNL